MAFSPCGDRLATGGADHLLLLWNVTTGRAEHRLLQHTSTVRSIAFSPDGTLLATSAGDAAHTAARNFDTIEGIAGPTLIGLPRQVGPGIRIPIQRTLTAPDGRALGALIVEVDPSYFAEVYIMKADGSEQKRLTNEPGYDGGTFFTKDGRIVWRHFDENGLIANVWTMQPDGTDKKQITDFGAMSWAPYEHPSGEYFLFASNKLGFENFEVFMVDKDGLKEPVRITYSPGFDGLPVPSPDGKQIAFTSSRAGGAGAAGQIYLAQWNHDAAMAALKAAGHRLPTFDKLRSSRAKSRDAFAPHGCPRLRSLAFRRATARSRRSGSAAEAETRSSRPTAQNRSARGRLSTNLPVGSASHAAGQGKHLPRRLSPGCAHAPDDDPRLSRGRRRRERETTQL